MMNLNRGLLRTPRPYPDESFKGYILRVTEANGYSTPAVILRLADMNGGLMQKGHAFKDRHRDALLRVLGLKISELSSLTGVDVPMRWVYSTYNFFGHSIRKYFVRLSQPRICPKCLRENNYIRKIWDLSAYTCCPEHKSLLLEKCPSCGAQISWDRANVSVCRCGQDWREVALDEISDGELTLSSLILRACRLQGGDAAYGAVRERSGTEPNPLYELGLTELLTAVYFVAGQQIGVVDVTGKYYAARMTLGELHNILKKAVAIFRYWPGDYFKLLERTRGKNRRGHCSTGLHRDFGGHYEAMFTEALPNFIRMAFTHYLATVWTGGHAGWCSRISDSELNNRSYISGTKAAEYLEVSLRTVSCLLDSGDLKGYKNPASSRTYMMVDVGSVEVVKERWGNTISSEEAEDLLGIGKNALRSIMKNGRITAIQGPTVTGQHGWRFERQTIVDFVSLVYSRISWRRLLHDITGIGFQKAIQKLSKLRLDVGAFVECILDGRITPVGRGDGSGIGALIFDEEEIDQLSIGAAVKRREGKCSLEEAARQLGISSEVAAFLVKRGLLAAERVAAGRGTIWAITPEAIDHCSNTYLTVGKIVKPIGASNRGASARLMAQGIRPVSGPQIDGGRIYLFEKVALDAVDIAAILPKRMDKTDQQVPSGGGLTTRLLAA